MRGNGWQVSAQPTCNTFWMAWPQLHRWITWRTTPSLFMMMRPDTWSQTSYRLCSEAWPWDHIQQIIWTLRMSAMYLRPLLASSHSIRWSLERTWRDVCRPTAVAILWSVPNAFAACMCIICTTFWQQWLRVLTRHWLVGFAKCLD